MPVSIIVAISAVSLMFATRIVLAAMAMAAGTLSPLGVGVQILLSVLILVGLYKGHRLAWQWGRVLGALGATICIFLAVMVLLAKEPKAGSTIVFGFSAFNAAILLTVVFSLGTKSAKRYFGLVCPACGSTKCKAGDFLFNKVKCVDCGGEWDGRQVSVVP